MNRLAIVVPLGLLLAVAAPARPAHAQIGDFFRRLPDILGGKTGAQLTDSKISAGLKQALEVATGNAVGLTGKLDGYFANQAIKILMPEQLRSLETGLRAVGFGGQVDAFVLSMNRAAERAAPAARAIFVDAITQMTFDDARKILSSHETAATEFFKGKTTDRLTAAFHPLVSRAMDEVGVTQQYKALTGLASAIPFFRPEQYDLDNYVVGKALDGLFVVVADEEKKIRKDPAARVTELLKEVFGAAAR